MLCCFSCYCPCVVIVAKVKGCAFIIITCIVPVYRHRHTTTNRDMTRVLPKHTYRIQGCSLRSYHITYIYAHTHTHTHTPPYLYTEEKKKGGGIIICRKKKEKKNILKPPKVHRYRFHVCVLTPGLSLATSSIHKSSDVAYFPCLLSRMYTTLILLTITIVHVVPTAN